MKKFLATFMGLFLCVAFDANAALYDADVQVDVTAKTVTEAKTKAMAKATRDALSQVVRDISTEKSVQQLNELTDNQLQHFIAGVMVLMEKSSDVRYIADLRVSVDENLLKEYMAENDMPLILAQEQEVLVIPVLEKEDGSLDLWGSGNIWRQVFMDKGPIKRGNLKIKTIDKNLGNISAVQTARLYDMTDGEYNELASFNKIHNIYVVKYSLKEKKVYVKSFPEKKVDELQVNDEELSELVDKALVLLKGQKKEESSEAFDASVKTSYDVVYEYPQLAKWTVLKKYLEENPQIYDFAIVSMGAGKVRFKFEYTGTIEKLQEYLSEAQYRITNEGGYYAIY